MMIIKIVKNNASVYKQLRQGDFRGSYHTFIDGLKNLYTTYEEKCLNTNLLQKAPKCFEYLKTAMTEKLNLDEFKDISKDNIFEIGKKVLHFIKEFDVIKENLKKLVDEKF